MRYVIERPNSKFWEDIANKRMVDSRLGKQLMNERLTKLAQQANIEFTYDPTEIPVRAFVECWEDELEKFAELIVRECINQAHSVGDLRGANDDMVYGADTAAVQISKHFRS